MRPIDADAFKEYIQKCFETANDLFKEEYKSFAAQITLGLLKDIDDQPTVYAAQNKGEWIEIRSKRTGAVIALRCNKCLRHPKHAVRTDFCPHCGADMR